MAKAKAEYSKPTSQVDLERRLENGNKSDLELSTYNTEAPEPDGNARVFALEDNETENYLGVDPVYQNYANDALKPLRAEEGPEAELEVIAYGESEVFTEQREPIKQDEPVQKVMIVDIGEHLKSSSETEDVDSTPVAAQPPLSKAPTTPVTDENK